MEYNTFSDEKIYLYIFLSENDLNENLIFKKFLTTLERSLLSILNKFQNKTFENYSQEYFLQMARVSIKSFKYRILNNMLKKKKKFEFHSQMNLHIFRHVYLNNRKCK